MSKKKRSKPSFLPTPKPSARDDINKIRVPPQQAPRHPVRTPTSNRRGG
jgi:hypothetical protein